MRTTLATFLALSAALSVSLECNGLPRYHLTPIRPPDTTTDAQLSGINNRGVVSGTFFTNAAGNRPFIWSHTDGYRQLPSPGPQLTSAGPINDAGNVLIHYYWPQQPSHIYTPATGTVPLGPGLGVALAINNRGQVAGDLDGAYRWTPSVPNGVEGTFLYLDGYAAYAINDHGQVAGYGFPSGPWRAFLWDPDNAPGLPLWFDPLESDLYSRAYGMNDIGQLVGISYSGNELSWHAVIMTRERGTIPMGPLGLGLHSVAYDINNQGVAVGSLASRAMAWTEADGMVDLRSLVDNPGDWQLTWARAINERGQIAGSMVDAEGRLSGFLLDPIPEPAAATTVATGLILLAATRRRTRT